MYKVNENLLAHKLDSNLIIIKKQTKIFRLYILSNAL